MPVPMDTGNDAGSCVAAGGSSHDDDVDMGGIESEGSTASGTSSKFQDTSFNQALFDVYIIVMILLIFSSSGTIIIDLLQSVCVHFSFNI